MYLQAETCRIGTAHSMDRVCLCDDGHPAIMRGVMTVNTTLLDDLRRTQSFQASVGFSWARRVSIYLGMTPRLIPTQPTGHIARKICSQFQQFLGLNFPLRNKTSAHTSSPPSPIRLTSTDIMGFTDFVSETGLHVLNSWVRTNFNTTSGTLD